MTDNTKPPEGYKTLGDAIEATVERAITRTGELAPEGDGPEDLMNGMVVLWAEMTSLATRWLFAGILIGLSRAELANRAVADQEKSSPEFMAATHQMVDAMVDVT
jgi:hypothetical protein